VGPQGGSEKVSGKISPVVGERGGARRVREAFRIDGAGRLGRSTVVEKMTERRSGGGDGQVRCGGPRSGRRGNHVQKEGKRGAI
jgi:hypothetical protein